MLGLLEAVDPLLGGGEGDAVTREIGMEWEWLQPWLGAGLELAGGTAFLRHSTSPRASGRAHSSPSAVVDAGERHVADEADDAKRLARFPFVQRKSGVAASRQAMTSAFGSA